MRLRFTLAILAAVLWSQVGYHYLPIDWILVGAVIIAILFTIGIEPRRRDAQPTTRARLARRVPYRHR